MGVLVFLLFCHLTKTNPKRSKIKCLHLKGLLDKWFKNVVEFRTCEN